MGRGGCIKFFLYFFCGGVVNLSHAFTSCPFYLFLSFFLTMARRLNLVPYPAKVEVEGPFLLDVRGPFAYEFIGQTILCGELNEEFRGVNGPKLKVQVKMTPDTGDVQYHIKCEDMKIYVETCSEVGLFLASRTLKQFREVYFSIEIWDYPRFDWRGVMIDISRHFFGLDVLKRVIDRISDIKMNILHLHLTDDQGWRIEMPSYPNLTTKGACGDIDSPWDSPKFLSLEEMKELILYAKKKFVKIVPEIDWPAHVGALLHSYPLSCSKNPPGFVAHDSYKLWKNDGICYFIDIDAPGVKELVNAVLDTLCPMFDVFHIGGDESRTSTRFQYSNFINYVVDFLKKRGKEVIGWQEVGKSGNKNVTIQQWMVPARFAKRNRDGDDMLPCLPKYLEGYDDFILSPASKCYMDMKYPKTQMVGKEHLGLGWVGTVSLQTAYSWNPTRFWYGIHHAMIRGIEAPLWTETVRTEDEMMFMLFPRLYSIAEVAWTPQEMRSFPEFKKSVEVLFREEMKPLT